MIIGIKTPHNSFLQNGLRPVIAGASYAGQAKTKFKGKNLIKITFIALFTIANLSYFNIARAVSSSELVSLANSSRAQEGLGSLRTNSKLESAAFAKVNDMIEKDYFAHTSPDGKTPWDFINDAGYNYVYAGENLAIGYADSAELHNAWMDSPSHRDNIMNPNFKDVGVAVVSGEYQGGQTTVVVQMFGATSFNEPNNNPSPVVASADSNNQSKTKQFDLILEKTSFSPNKIFADEEVDFKVTLTGDATEIFYTVGDQKVDLKESVKSEQNSKEKTYEKKEKIQKEGDYIVTLTVIDKWGNREAKDLGELTVAKKIISKNTSSANSPLVEAIKGFAENNISLIALVMALATLGAAGFLVFRFRKFGKFI